MASRVFNLLIVDDDPLVHQSLKTSLSSSWKAFSAQSEELVPYERFYHAALIDMHLHSGSKNPAGLRVIEKLIRLHPQTDIIAISGDLDRDLMEACLKAGAQRFLAKPLSPEEVSLMLDKIEALWELRSLGSASGARTAWIGESVASLKIKKQIASLRGENQTVLIEGETGSGKEIAARLLHEQENERPLIAVNIAGIPENLFESELFGHVKGAFTGADQNKIGLVEAANGGDLFLDEIEALPLAQQVKLLRFLESGEIHPVGAKENRLVRTRVIAASNRPLDEMVAAGEFREDLYFRLSGQKMKLPPLRERSEDIPLLARYFLEQERPRRNKSFSEDGLQALQNYPWPGNVRELKRICAQLTLTSPLPVVRAEDVKGLLAPPKSSSLQTPDLSRGLDALTRDYEAFVIRAALAQSQGKEEAADLLGVSRSNLYKKISEYKIETEEKSR
jgi:DNA-binding NtrC family response regulator